MIGWGEKAERPPEDDGLLRRFCGTLSPRYARDLLAAHPQLLIMLGGKAYKTILREIPGFDPDEGPRWRQRLDVLYAAATAGPDTAFGAFVAPGPDNGERLRRAQQAVRAVRSAKEFAAALYAYPELLCDTIHRRLVWEAEQTEAELRQGPEASAFLVHRCMRVGVAAGTAQGDAQHRIELVPTVALPHIGCDTVAEARELMDVVGDFIGPECGLAERVRLLAEHPVLLTEEAVRLIDIVGMLDMPESVHTELLFARSILTTAETHGVEEALLATAFGRILLEPDPVLAAARADEYLTQFGAQSSQHIALFFRDSSIQEPQPHEWERMAERHAMFNERADRRLRHVGDLLDDLVVTDARLEDDQHIGPVVLRLRGLLFGNPDLLGPLAQGLLDKRAQDAGQEDAGRRLSGLKVLLLEVPDLGFDIAMGRFLHRRAALATAAPRTSAEDAVGQSEAYVEELESSGEPAAAPVVERLLRDLVLASGLPDTSPRLRIRLLNSQAALLRWHFAATRQIDHLDQAIMLLEEVVAFHDRVAPDIDDGSWLLGNLGEALLQRYALTRDDADLGRAIAAQLDAVNRARANGTVSAMLLRQFAHGTADAAIRTGLTLFMESAVDALREARLLARQGTVPHLVITELLATLLFIDAQADGDHEGVEESFALLREVLADSADLPGHHAMVRYNLARNLGMKGGPYLAEAMTLMREALADAEGVNIPLATVCATWLGEWEGASGNWEQAASHYVAAWAQTRQVTDSQATRAHTELHLRGVTGRTATAAFALVRTDKPMDAAVLLEQGLAVLTGNALTDDPQWLDRLTAAGHPELARSYAELAAALRRQDGLDLTRLGGGLGGGAPLSVTSTATGVRSMRQRLGETVEAIRNIDGFADFHRAARASDVLGAACEAPLVYLAATAYGGFALVIGRDRSIESLVLPELTEAAVRAQVQKVFGDPVRGVESAGQWLWTAAMGPVLAAVRGADRICLVPAGGLHLLPLHAAWTPDPHRPTRRRYALDDLLITYAPTARAVTVTRARAQAARPGRLLVVDEPTPVAGPPLPHSAAECAAALAGWDGESVYLKGEAPTRDAVRAHLCDAALAHLSCHAQADVVNPLASRLEVAHHGAVTVADLLGDRLDGLRLAVLSACKTGQVGTTAPDEAIGFPTTLIQAGAAAVVSSLWAVPELGTTELMVRFAREWRTDGTTYGEALRTAQQEVRDSTVAEKRRLLADVMPAGTTPFAVQAATALAHARPYHWAAFAFHGADGPPLRSRP
ncbi:CHAT domain-containing protein [Streptomyces bambusae]|uniref:CHAT domain-containing protein n=1 Tax=Streptomyces bambusae TaxID=1550616 RepID=UPI001CFF532E|nr:CHAT domain-containing protein [Streptomyces bambusae]MCB5164439.1 CHAT domain-containing protein [Streptomyces bambusae]